MRHYSEPAHEHRTGDADVEVYHSERAEAHAAACEMSYRTLTMAHCGGSLGKQRAGERRVSSLQNDA